MIRRVDQSEELPEDVEVWLVAGVVVVVGVSAGRIKMLQFTAGLP